MTLQNRSGVIRENKTFGNIKHYINRGNYKILKCILV